MDRGYDKCQPRTARMRLWLRFRADPDQKPPDLGEGCGIRFLLVRHQALSAMVGPLQVRVNSFDCPPWFSTTGSPR
jgi:hypothetical protein